MAIKNHQAGKRIGQILSVPAAYMAVVILFYYGAGKPFFNSDGHLMPLWRSIYWQIAGGIGIVLFLYTAGLIHLLKQGKDNYVLHLFDLWDDYQFLLKQLVGRDFRIRYRRSVLGMLWSVINPMLNMTVQYLVFSTIFRSDIDHYPVYLLSGTVLYSFFSESKNLGMSAIVGNAGLLTKVYVPKYVFPVSKVLSSGINLLLSFLPLLILVLFSGLHITRAWLLLPYVLACLFVLCTGMAFLLSAALVFFRDIQFIWSVLVLVLNYATPIFYPEEILPEMTRQILWWNPLLHILRVFRALVIDGIAPDGMEMALCTVFPSAILVIGFLVFRRTQGRFLFHI